MMARLKTILYGSVFPADKQFMTSKFVSRRRHLTALANATELLAHAGGVQRAVALADDRHDLVLVLLHEVMAVVHQLRKST